MNNDFEQKVSSLMQQFSELDSIFVNQALDNARVSMDFDTRREFDDLVAVAKARIDPKAAIEYFFRDSRTGSKIKLTHIQQLELDFIYMAWKLGMVPLVCAPMGSGKTSLAVMIIANEIGMNQNIRTQIVCTAEDSAQKRGALIARLVLTRDYQKIFPNIKKARGKPWNSHNINVERTMIADENLEEFKNQIDDPETTDAIDATMAAWGIDSKALGSRVDKAIFDDLANEDNSINSPGEADKIDSKIDSTWISRRESPVGVKNSEYSLASDPYRCCMIGTPWAETDCVFRRIKREGYASIVIGVNDSWTGYNVEIWGLPDDMCNELERKYKIIIDEEILKEDKLKLFEKRGYKIGDCIEGYNVYKDFKAKKTFTIPLSRPAEWYLRIYKQNPRKFDSMYRCIVVSERERAFPEFAKCLTDDYNVAMVELEGIDDSGKKIIKGYQGKVISPPKGAALYASVDLSGAGRAGTVITVCYLLANYKRFPIDIRVGAWSGDEISDQISKVFKEYPNILNIFVENAGQQDIFIKEMTKHKKEYPWWMKVKPFLTSAKTKNEKTLGVLAMDVAFSNGGFIIANAPGQPGHPTVGDPRFPEGCPCGFCVLIRDCRGQLRLGNVSSDAIMSLWMSHSSMPQLMENPTVGAPEGVNAYESGKELMQALEEGIAGSDAFLNTLMGGQKQQDPELKKHFREDGSEILEWEDDWLPKWSDEYDESGSLEENSEESDDTDYNQPQFLRTQKPRTNLWKRIN